MFSYNVILRKDYLCVYGTTHAITDMVIKVENDSREHENQCDACIIVCSEWNESDEDLNRAFNSMYGLLY